MPSGKSPCVVLTGASGSGKTTLAEAIKRQIPSLRVLSFDSIGVPRPEAMAAYGSGHQPGGAWQRAMTLQWMERIAELLRAGNSVLFEGQMRIAFILEAFTASGVENGKIVLVDCDDETRRHRLTHHREQPELAHEHMMNWAAYLREEARENRCEILNTGQVPFDRCCSLIVEWLGVTSQ